jgi:hypothetical protein
LTVKRERELMVQGGFYLFLEIHLDMDILWGENGIIMMKSESNFVK